MLSTHLPNGRYTDTVREAYMKLMCMRVVAKNVQKIIKTVMGEMAGILPRLPGSTFVARSHLKEEIHSTEGNLTVGQMAQLGLVSIMERFQFQVKPCVCEYVTLLVVMLKPTRNYLRE
jgi:hypothetical protein